MNIKKLIFMLSLFSTLYGCDVAITNKQKVIKDVKEYLNDPDSAKFENIREGNEEKYHCGWVNAKNRMGGYVGLTRFSHHRITDVYAEVKLLTDPPTNSDFKWLRHTSSFAERYTEIRNKCQSIRDWETACKNKDADSMLPEMCIVMLDGKNGEFIEKLHRDF